MKLTDLTDRTFERWTVIRREESTRRTVVWLCRCVCGTTKIVPGIVLTRGKSKSCGCLRIEHGRRHGATAQLRHGEGGNGKETPEYRAWTQAKSRCNNKNHTHYESYGGRGIRMHPAWEASFETFLAAVGRRPSPKHSIDREDNERGYEPGNVRWATPEEQQRNRRQKTGPVRVITIHGETKPLGEWLTKTGTHRRTFYERLKRGLSVERALGLHVDH